MHEPILNLFTAADLDVILTNDHRKYPLNKLAAKMIGLQSFKSIFLA